MKPFLLLYFVMDNFLGKSVFTRKSMNLKCYNLKNEKFNLSIDVPKYTKMTVSEIYVDPNCDNIVYAIGRLGTKQYKFRVNVNDVMSENDIE